MCKHWLRGLCKKGEACEFLHEYNLRKMPECQFFSKNGFCTQSPDCLYLHIDPLTKISPCPNYERGFCKLGPECNKRHVRKVMCPRYLTGFCPLGPDCDMSHPKFVGITDKMRITLDPALRAALAEREKRSGQKDLDFNVSLATNEEAEGAQQQQEEEAIVQEKVEGTSGTEVANREENVNDADENDTSEDLQKETADGVDPELVTAVDIDEAVVPEEGIVSNIQAEE